MKKLGKILNLNIKNANKFKLKQIKKELDINKVVVIKNQKINERELINFSKNFGKIHTHPLVNGMNKYPEILQVIKEKNEIIDFGEKWHSDNSFLKVPSTYSILYGYMIPNKTNDTLFCDMNYIYNILPQDIKNKIKNKKACHDAFKSFNRQKMKNNDIYINNNINFNLHPIVTNNTLFINEMFTTFICDITPSESRNILNKIFSIINNNKYYYRHKWDKKDIIIWDNRYVQHMVEENKNSGKRIIRRITVI